MKTIGELLTGVPMCGGNCLYASAGKSNQGAPEFVQTLETPLHLLLDETNPLSAPMTGSNMLCPALSLPGPSEYCTCIPGHCGCSRSRRGACRRCSPSSPPHRRSRSLCRCRGRLRQASHSSFLPAANNEDREDLKRLMELVAPLYSPVISWHKTTIFHDLVASSLNIGALRY